MLEFETSACHASGQPEFRFKLERSAVPEADVRWLIETLHEMVARGERFRDGETLQIGWGLLKVRGNTDGSLTLLEPDYSSMPIEWVDSVTQTLADLRLQKDVCESYFDSKEIDFPSLRQHCIVCTRLRGASRIVMERMAASPPDSGWFIGCAEDAHDHNDPDQLYRMSLYEAVLQNRQARKLLALPAGTLLEAEEADIQLYHLDALVQPKRGSYIDRVQKTRA